MASFTDIIPQFNPYIQQLPVEAMVTVGMEKQRRYDEGVQKIQTQIDNIAGMDVIRDVDKAYLQSKLNELGNNLRTVAAGDFSNFQLVNSVSGMTNQIGKDPIVQGAVSSTAWYRKQRADMEKAIADGKSSQQNQWDFSQKVNNWLSSTDVNQRFTDRYTPYIDVDKKFLDVLKSIAPNLKEQDIPYEIDPVTGKPNYAKIAAAMQRVSTEDISAARIENALRASLTPDDINQLNINGRYTFRGYATPEQLSVYSKTRYEGQLAEADKQISALEGLANMSSSSPAEKTAALNSIQSLKAQKAQLRQQLDNEIEMIRQNPEEAKGIIYRNGAIAQFANAFSWEKSKTNVLTNPVLEAQHWERRFALDQSQFNLSVRAQNWKETKDKFDMMNTDREFQLKFQKQQAELFGVGSDFTTYGGQSTQVKDPVVAMRNDVNLKEQVAMNGIDAMAKAIPGATRGMIETRLAEYQNGKKDAIPVEWRDEADVILANRRDANRLNAAIKIAEKNALSSPEVRAAQDAVAKDIRSLPTLTIGGQTFTQREILDYLSKENYERDFSGTGGAGRGRLLMDESNLTDKEKILYRWKQSGSGSESSDKLISATLRRYNNALVKNKQVVTSINEAVSKELLNKTGAYIPMLSNYTVSNKEGAMSRDRFEGIAMSALLKFDKDIAGIPGGAATLSRDEAAVARGWLAGKDKDDVQYKRLVQGDQTFLVLAKGGEEKLIPLTAEEAGQLPRVGAEPSYQQRQIVMAQQLNNGNTNPTNNPTQAQFQQYNFGNIRSLAVSADLQWNQNNHSKNYLNLNVKLPSGWKNLQLDNNPMDVNQATNFVATLTDAEVKQLFLSDPRVPEAWKEEIRNLK